MLMARDPPDTEVEPGVVKAGGSQFKVIFRGELRLAWAT